jgi:hypothetical protein
MSETRWTKGPWRQSHHGDTKGVTVSGGDYNSVATVRHQRRTPEELAANAALIAAAPDLYAALAEARDGPLEDRRKEIKCGCLSGHPMACSLRLLLDRIDAVLARARGEAP